MTNDKATKFNYIWVLRGNYGYGWEDLTAEDSFKEIRGRRKEYMENEGGNYRIINRRELNEA